LTYSPRTKEGQSIAGGIDTAGSYLGPKEGEFAGEQIADLTGSPAIGAGVNAFFNLPQYLLGLKGGKAALGERPPLGAELDATGAPRAPAPEAAPTAAPAPEAPFKVNDPKAAETLGIKTERAEKDQGTGNLSPDQQQERIDLAGRVGLTKIRKSAIEGDAQAAADDYDSTKYTDDPHGEVMRDTLKAERAGIQKHAESIVEDSGGTPGIDQSSNKLTGRTIAQPFDDLAAHIDQVKQNMYAEAKARKGNDIIDTQNIEKALDDPTLTNSLLAQGKENFLKGAKSQYQHFLDNNGGYMTVGVAEQYRQFLNTLWKTDKNASGFLKDALDSDVGSAVGEDVYGPARGMHALGKTLLDDPEGVSSLFSRDPKHPANRTTALEDIPDKLANMDHDQFKNVVDTLHGMPKELQPQAEAAMDALRAHMGNRLLKAGSATETQWNKTGVNKELAANSENFKTAFADKPELAAKIKDLKDIGEVTRFNSGYRGAHAQASNMIRKGIGLGAEAVAGTAGGVAGSMLTGSPFIAAGAAMGAKAAAAKGMAKLDRGAARRQAEERVIDLRR
jgi:hypothetical protein